MTIWHLDPDSIGEDVVPVEWQETPTVETLRDALVELGLMEPDGS
jgi:hypothetical protein